MPWFNNAFLERVREKSDLVTLISEDTELKGSGDRYMGLCPFPNHSEKSPSFSVSQSRQVYHCFGCKSSGNIFTYLQKQRGMSWPEAVELLARKASIPLPKGGRPLDKGKLRHPTGPSLASLFDLNRKICSFYEQQLNQSNSDSPVQRYLKKRGWAGDTAKAFRLGYAPKGNALLHFLKSQGERSLALKLGLLSRSSMGQQYDCFRHRLIFPIVSVHGEVIGFGARALDDSSPPKYINSKESPVFHKGKVFYGLNVAARHIRSSSVALLVEGYADFLSLYQAGFENMVASLGTALTADHARLLRRYVHSVVLIFDGDMAGLKAGERSLPLLLAEGLEVKFFALPKGIDPDDFIRSKGKEAFLSRLREAEDMFFFILRKKYQRLREKGQSITYLIEEMAPLLIEVKNQALRAVYEQRLFDLFGSDSVLLKKSLIENMKKAERRKKNLAAASHNPHSGRVNPNVIEHPISDSPLSARVKEQRAEDFYQQAQGPIFSGGKVTSREGGGFHFKNSFLLNEPATLKNSQSPDASLRAKHQKAEPGGRAAQFFSLSQALEPERLLLVLCLKEERFLKSFIERGGLSLVQSQGLCEIFKEVIDRYGQDIESFPQLLNSVIDRVAEPELLFESSYAVFNSKEEKNHDRIFEDCIRFLQNNKKRLSAASRIAEMKMKDSGNNMQSLERVFQLTKQRLDSSKPPR